ncbi:hypothetical protein [Streptomyces halobius]|uniref:Uncharacterized protein n=1 Tax=Streptomyces halobius TaxID=2879846 RepID=A0ABY4MKD0_9ACTN|nr:hypothetical protein [Streptomyces halobius]UQA97528.1 hypothetical protein K9S39_41805 [Streptomyces halobius]
MKIEIEQTEGIVFAEQVPVLAALTAAVFTAGIYLRDHECPVRLIDLFAARPSGPPGRARHPNR